MKNKNKEIVIALSKGRILEQSLPLLAEAGIKPLESIKESRKLIFPTTNPKIKLLVVRASDAPTYVEYGAADLGIAGKDVLLEAECKNIFELVDLKVGKCRLCVAKRQDTAELDKTAILKVASKYVKSAAQYFAEQGRQVRLIKLYGSMELAPLVDLADCIVDLVDTGNTLRANGLEVAETIREISSRLIVNRASFTLKREELLPIVRAIETAVENRKN
ncbi:MAG: ATP phosphoribosyltransferase [Cardiobacteriaceae bacterium]|nr:ATP phosphoribosyltransferase [Cardiobacteriaceae bacterium]